MIKIDIISGFLGAGKTTFIKRLLDTHLKTEKVVLIENEYGEVSVDTDILSDTKIEIKEISQGCICCSLVGDFSKSLNEVIKQMSPDRIIIEPSGVGKLSDIIGAIKSAGLADDINSLVCMVDAKKAKMYDKNFGEFFVDQIKNAGTVILSRTDVSKEETIESAVEIVRKHNERCVLVTTPINELSDEELLKAYEGFDMHMLEKSLLEELEHHHDDDDDECDDPNCECHHHHHHADDDEECECHHHHDHDHEDDYDSEEHGFKRHKVDDDHYDSDEHEHHHNIHKKDELRPSDHHEDDDDYDHVNHGYKPRKNAEDEDEHEHHHHHHDHDEEECDDPNCECHHHHHHHHADEVFTSFGMETIKKYDINELKKTLDDIANGKYGVVVRSKGIIKGNDNKWYVFNLTPEEVSIEPTNSIPTGKIVVIGSKINKEEIKKLF